MTVLATATPDPAAERLPLGRRWIPLSLKLFAAILMALGGGSALWVGVPAYRQSVAIREIRRIGGDINFKPRSSVPEWSRGFLPAGQSEAFDEVFAVWFIPSKQTFWRRYRYDSFSGSPWTDGDVEVDDSTVGCVRGIPHLQALLLRWTNVGDAGFTHIGSLRNLEVLDLEGTDVTDASVDSLKGLKSLRFLTVQNTRLTERAVAELKRALPDCRVLSGPWPALAGPLDDAPEE